MPQPRSSRRFVGIKFDQDMYDTLLDLAAREGWTWDHGGAVGPQPSVSEATRRLVAEALAARRTGAHVAISTGGLAWIDEQAAAEGVERDTMVKALLSEARDARMATRKPVNAAKNDRRKT